MGLAFRRDRERTAGIEEVRGRLVVTGWFLLAAAVGRLSAAEPAVWQWSVPVGESRAYLWIPEDCERVRAVLFAQHNMIERRIMEHPEMRRTLADCGIAEVFVFPSKDPVFDFNHGAGEWFQQAMDRLASVSGYEELSEAPVAPMGHSAHSSFPWNFAAWNPGRTLAVMSVKGDAPLTGLTGSGRPNPDWEKRSLDGVPGLMVMGEYEWWEKRLDPLLAFRDAHPAVPLAVFADVGHGHFEAPDELIGFLAMFIKKAAEARLPDDASNKLRPVDPGKGVRVARWRNDGPVDRSDSFWCFDEEMARVTEGAYRSNRGTKEQQVGFFQDGSPVPISNSHTGTELVVAPDDKLAFRLDAGFIAPLPPDPPTATKDRRPPVVTKTPEPAPDDAHAPGDVVISKIVGPMEDLGSGRFRLSPDWMFPASGKGPYEAWVIATHAGDDGFKSAVRQALVRIPKCIEGAEQTIRFPDIEDPAPGVRTVPLSAMSDRGEPVRYYIKEGPAVVDGKTLRLTPLPPWAKRPVKVVVVAWQYGRPAEPKVRGAEPVEREFWIR